jgi:peptidoglycan/xylan/chitin deacetylase (PgdA/CDA1 family)
MIFRDDDISYLTNLEEFKKVQEIFDHNNVRHTVALICKDIDKNPELIDFIRSKDIDVQIHCWEHIPLTEYHDKLIDHLSWSISTIETYFGNRPTVLYPPWNKSDSFVEAKATDLGLKVSNKKITLSKYIQFKGKVSQKVINFHYWAYEEAMLLDAAMKIYNGA